MKVRTNTHSSTNARRIAAVIAAGAVSVGLGACGSSKSGTGQPSAGATSPTTTGGLSRSELAAKANAICAAAKAKTPPFKAPANPSNATKAAEIGKALPIYEDQTKQFQTLTPAADVANDWRAFVAAQVAFYQLFVSFKQQLDANHPIGPADRDKFDSVIQRLADAAGKIGFTCTPSSARGRGA